MCDVEELSTLLKLFAVGDVPTRHSVGTRGHPIQLVSNLYGVSVSIEEVFHYDVCITYHGCNPNARQAMLIPSSKKYRAPSTALNHRVIRELARRSLFGGCVPAYDGRKKLYLTKLLGPESQLLQETVTIGLDPEGDLDEFARTASFDVSLKLVARIPMSDLRPDVIQALDIMVRTGPLLCPRNVAVGRSFFTRQNNTCDISVGGCRELWYGYYCSIRPGQWKPLLNVNISATLFHESLPLVEYTAKLLKKNLSICNNGLLDSERKKLEKELQAVKIEVTHLPYRRRYKVCGISKLPAYKCFFSIDKQQISVTDYFANQYNIHLQYPGLQCVLTRGKNGQWNYLPMEVCRTIKGQHAKVVEPDQTAVLIRKTALPPAERFRNVDTFVQEIVTQSAHPQLREFGLRIELTPTKVMGRVLAPPHLNAGTVKPIIPREGHWRTNRFLVPVEITDWGIADCFGSRRVAEFSDNLQRLGAKLGMRIHPPTFITDYRGCDSAREMLLDIKTKLPLTLLTVVILGKTTPYEQIKQFSETDRDLLMMTQCVRGQNIDGRKHDQNFCVNLLMKINSKMGGINNGLHEPFIPPSMRRPYIVFGADVSHPAPLNKGQPSIAALVGSLDPIPSQYHTLTTFQRSKTCNRLEYIAALKDMVKDCMRAFYRKNNTKPTHLFFFRDGVSDCQFEAVRAFEVLQVRLACKELEEDYEPPLTFLVVQKRHQVRFRPERLADGHGHYKNIPPGTVIEETVTHPKNLDYFLCSHAGIQSTSKPAHYQVIHDDANLSADELQAISYNLCHVYGRCSRSVSIPAPVYYAHLAAARAKDHLKAVGGSSRCSSSNNSSGFEDDVVGDPNDLSELKRRASFVDARLRNCLYYV